MKHLLILKTAALLLCGFGTSWTPAAWAAGWSQPPVVSNANNTILGGAELSSHLLNRVLADDFICTDPNPIASLRWWGSYAGQPTNAVESAAGPFEIMFFGVDNTDEPYRLPQGNSLVPQLVWVQGTYVGVNQTGDFVYVYDAVLSDPFPQIYGQRYFLSIDRNTLEPWGWQTTQATRENFAASAPGHNLPWATYMSHTDLAFDLFKVPEPGPVILLALGGGALWVLAARSRRFRR